MRTSPGEFSFYGQVAKSLIDRFWANDAQSGQNTSLSKEDQRPVIHFDGWSALLRFER
jgi:hypothetical protein